MNKDESVLIKKSTYENWVGLWLVVAVLMLVNIADGFIGVGTQNTQYVLGHATGLLITQGLGALVLGALFYAFEGKRISLENSVHWHIYLDCFKYALVIVGVVLLLIFWYARSVMG